MLRSIFIEAAVLVAVCHAAPAKASTHAHPRDNAPTQLIRHLIHSGNHAALDVKPVPKDARNKRHSAALTIDPSEYGGDPTGKHDSAVALQTCVQRCVNLSLALDPLGRFPGDTSFGNGKAIHNAGGCLIDLDGGEYMISKTITIPEYVANINIGHGSIASADRFTGEFLLVVGKKGSCKVPQGSCNIDINFPELFLDGRHVTSAMQINNVMGVTIGPGGYFLNFTEYGVQINAGHEVQMDRCWLGETNFDFDHEKQGAKPNATAIQVNGNDHYILNTVVFSSKIGLEVNGAADYVSGVHVWFPLNHAVAFPETKAFHITGSKNRFSGCYIDGGRAVFEGDGLKVNIWERGFECCQIGSAAPGTTSSGIVLVGNSIGPGLQIINNEFQGGSIFHVTESTTVPSKYSIKGVRIAHNSMKSGVKGTRSIKSLTQNASTNWFFDFCDELVFQQIASVRINIVAETGFPRAISRPPDGCKVLVETDIAVTGTIEVEVDSSEASTLFG